MSDSVERRIRQAVERGEFDDLPGAGQPLDLDRPYDPHWWVKAWIERDREAGRQIEDLLAVERQARRLWAATSIAQLNEIMDDIDTSRAAAGLDPLDRDETRRIWQDVVRHRTS